MDDYIAMAYGVAQIPSRARLAAVTRAPDLATLATLVRALAPGADMRLVAAPAAMHCAGRPIVGVARVDGRTIYLCGPEAPAAALAPVLSP
jgi:hypothetical protein